jgi:hypothetical protein
VVAGKWWSVWGREAGWGAGDWRPCRLYRFRTRHGSRDLRFGWMSRVGQDRGLCLLVSSI